MDMISRMLNKENISSLFFVVSLIFLSQLFELFSLNLSNFNNIFIIKYINNYQNEITNIFYSSTIFNTYCFLLILSKPVIILILYILKTDEYNHYKNVNFFSLEILISNIITYQVFTLELTFILYKFNIIRFTIFDYHNMDMFLYNINSINDFISKIYVIILLIIQAFSMSRIITK